MPSTFQELFHNYNYFRSPNKTRPFFRSTARKKKLYFLTFIQSASMSSLMKVWMTIHPQIIHYYSKHDSHMAARRARFATANLQSDFFKKTKAQRQRKRSLLLYKTHYLFKMWPWERRTVLILASNPFQWCHCSEWMTMQNKWIKVKWKREGGAFLGPGEAGGAAVWLRS